MVSTIGCYLITRNNADSIGSLVNRLSLIFDDCVVLDTGSSDNTKELAKENGARVFDYKYQRKWSHPFIDDFAKARNQSLSYLDTDWVCWFDTDDMPQIDVLQALYDAIQKCPDEDEAVATFYTVKKDPITKSFYIRFPKTRAWKKDSSYHWEGRVHEDIVGDEDKLFLVPIEIPTAHFNEESRGRRNLIIFEDMLQNKEEFKPYQYFFMAREYKIDKDFANSYYWAERFIELMEGKEDVNKRFVTEAYLLMGHYYNSLNNIDMARKHALQAMQIEDRTPLPFLFYGETYLKEKNYAQAIPWFMHAFNLPPLDERYVHYHAEKTYIPLGWLAICNLMIGNHDHAKILYNKALEYEPNDEFLSKYSKLFDKVEQVENHGLQDD